MPLYLINKTKIRSNITKLKKAFADKSLDFEIFYSVKTNFSEPALSAVKESGSGFEVLSGFEYERVKNFTPKALVLNGPGKQLELVENILNNIDLLYFNIDNDTDLEILSKLSPKLLDKVKIGLRIFLNTSGVWNRFGYDIASHELAEMVRKVNAIKKLSGFHFHFSTNNFKIANYQLLLSRIREFCDNFNIELEFLDIGGGLPAQNEFVYEDEIYQKLPSLVSELFSKVKIISEVGRNIIADAVNLETEVISLKKIGSNKFHVNVDTNVMHFPCYYEQKYWVEYTPMYKSEKQPTEIEIFGNSCMQVDRISNFMVIEQAPNVGDKVVVHNIGAYSSSQAANFITEVPKIKIHG
jgi:diaminopimelate decarboxylase